MPSLFPAGARKFPDTTLSVRPVEEKAGSFFASGIRGRAGLTILVWRRGFLLTRRFLLPAGPPPPSQGIGLGRARGR